MTPPQVITSERGPLEWWGSECMECGNATPDSMTCDCCQKSDATKALWMEA